MILEQRAQARRELIKAINSLIALAKKEGLAQEMGCLPDGRFTYRSFACRTMWFDGENYGFTDFVEKLPIELAPTVKTADLADLLDFISHFLNSRI